MGTDGIEVDVVVVVKVDGPLDAGGDGDLDIVKSTHMTEPYDIG